MPTYNVPTEEGLVRITAPSPREAVQMVRDGQGLVLPRLAQPEPQRAAPGLYTEPPPPADAEVYNPGIVRPPSSAQAPFAGPLERLVALGGQVASRAAFPTAGSLALGVGGQFVPGLAAVPPTVREAAGSVLGTGANMLLGLEQPSMEQLLMAAAMPASVRGSGRLAARVVPGSAAARATGLVDEAMEVPNVVRRGVTGTPAALFGQAQALNPDIPLTMTSQVASHLLSTEAKAPAGLTYGRVKAVADDLATIGKATAEQTVTDVRLSPILDDLGRPIVHETVLRIPGRTGALPLEQLEVVRQRIGALIGEITNPDERAAYKQLYAGLLTDVEAAARKEGGEGAQALLQGIQQQRRVFAADDLQDLISGPTGAISQPRPVDGLQTLNTGRLIKELERPRESHRLLADFLEQHPTEKAEILAILQDMNRRNVKLLPPGGTMFGSGVALARGGAGYLAAQGLNKIAGTEVLDLGTTAAVTTFGSQLIARALLTSTGRRFLREAMVEGPALNTTQLFLQLAGQGVRPALGATPVSTAVQAVRAPFTTPVRRSGEEGG